MCSGRCAGPRPVPPGSVGPTPRYRRRTPRSPPPEMTVEIGCLVGDHAGQHHGDVVVHRAEAQRDALVRPHRRADDVAGVLDPPVPAGEPSPGGLRRDGEVDVVPDGVGGEVPGGGIEVLLRVVGRPDVHRRNGARRRPSVLTGFDPVIGGTVVRSASRLSGSRPGERDRRWSGGVDTAGRSGRWRHDVRDGTGEGSTGGRARVSRQCTRWWGWRRWSAASASFATAWACRRSGCCRRRSTRG